MTAGQSDLLVLGRVLQGQQEDVVFRLRLQQLADTPLMSNGHRHDGEVVDPPVSPLDQKAELIGRLEGDTEQPVRVERQKNIQRQKHFPVR